MEPSVYILILLIITILVGSACCSGVEAAFLAVNSIRILELASKQKPKSSANQLLKLRKHLGRTLTVITITNNGFNIITAGKGLRVWAPRAPHLNQNRI